MKSETEGATTSKLLKHLLAHRQSALPKYTGKKAVRQELADALSVAYNYTYDLNEDMAVEYIEKILHYAIQVVRIDRVWCERFLASLSPQRLDATGRGVLLERYFPHPVKHILPPRYYQQYVEREELFSQLFARLAASCADRLIPVIGAPGTGKSALAIEAGYRLAEHPEHFELAYRFDEIIWGTAKRDIMYVDKVQTGHPFHSHFTNFDDVLQLIHKELSPKKSRKQVNGVTTEQIFSLFSRLSQQHRVLIILDSVEMIDTAPLEALQRELPNSCKILVTSRRRFSPERPIIVPEFTAAEAEKMARIHASERAIELPALEIDLLLSHTGHNAFAIWWVIDCMAQRNCTLNRAIHHYFDSSSSPLFRYLYQGEDHDQLLAALPVLKAFSGDPSGCRLEDLAQRAGLSVQVCETIVEQLTGLQYVSKHQSEPIYYAPTVLRHYVRHL